MSRRSRRGSQGLDKMLFKVQGSKFKVSDLPPWPQQIVVKFKPKAGVIAASRKRHEHESRARITSFLLALYAVIFVLPAPSLSWAHPPSATQKARGAERREVRIPIGDFTLTDQERRSFKFRSLRGRVVIVAFAYTTCPDVCPLITAALRQVQDTLRPAERDAVYIVTITTDPEVDDPKVLADYARRYGVDFSNWSLLTGSEQALTEVWRRFGVKVQRKARGLVDHTALTAVIDREGVMRFAYYGSAPDANVILKDMRLLGLRR